ncbi:MAG TPA: ComF family protein [Thiothrix sp.]|nr:ComF family protein [Thiothrix sp.]
MNPLNVLQTASFSSKPTLFKSWDYQLFPRHCVLCDSHISAEKLTHLATSSALFVVNIHEQLCEPCRAELPYNTSACAFCALPLPHYLSKHQTHCGRCAKEIWEVDQIFSPYRYADGMKYLISAFKFGKRLAFTALLAELFLQQLTEASLPPVDYLLPIPAHPKRLHQRGFNQSHELAKYLAQSLNLPLLDHTLQKQESTVAQASLSAKQRQQNLQHVFHLQKTLPAHARLAIVDDVITTGSTINAVAKHLRQGGATHLQAWSLARTDLRA